MQLDAPAGSRASLRRVLGGGLAVALCLALGCGSASLSTEPNPFLEDQTDPGKADSGYYTPDGTAVALELVADVEVAVGDRTHTPARVAELAATYLRKTGQLYLESWAGAATSEPGAEWLVDGTWLTDAQVAELPGATLSRLRLRGLAGVALGDLARSVAPGATLTARVPKRPSTIFAEAGSACADVATRPVGAVARFWDAWNPDKDGCPHELVTEATLTVTAVRPPAGETYPEHDQLLADGRVTVVMLLGERLDDAGEISAAPGRKTLSQMVAWLTEAGFTEVQAPVGHRLVKRLSSTDFEIDLYAPDDFSGPGDEEHRANLERAVAEHEIVIYDGTTIHTACDFWTGLDYLPGYQLVILGGSFGYDCGIQPLLEAKGSWANLDLLSGVSEPRATALDFAVPALAKLTWGIEHGALPRWRSILDAVRRQVGDSTFSVSGVRDNCFTPEGGGCPLRVSQDWRRDILATDLVLDLATRHGTATITMAPSASTEVSFDVGDLAVASVHGVAGPLDHTVAGGQLNVRVPATDAPVTLVVTYGFASHAELTGYNDAGLTMLWPYYCGSLFPCKPNPDDGLVFSLELLGVPAGQVAVYPTRVPAEAPSYMPAFAVGDYEHLDLGTTSAGTQVGVWYFPGEQAAAVTGTRNLTAAFDWVEQTYGPYAFGDRVGSVSADWGYGAYGGMEHHPYWHVGRTSMNRQETHIHEAIHGWFGNGVRIQCWEDFVLSEGTTSYVTARAVEAVEGAAAGNSTWLAYAQRLSWAVSSGNTVAWPEGCNRIDIINHPLWSAIPYMKGAFFLRAVEQEVGRAPLDRALARFYAEMVGSAATVQDLLDVIATETGFDPAPLADAWLLSLDVPPS